MPASSRLPEVCGSVPEGDTVYRAADKLDRALSGHRLVRTDFRVPQLATTDLAGATVTETVSRGKHLLTRIAAGTDRWTLHTHLKMEGSWRIYAVDQRWKRPAHQARVVLVTRERQAVGFSLGIVELLPTTDEDSVVGHLGPDLLGPDWDETEAVRRLLVDPSRPVGQALLDQANLAGARTTSMTDPFTRTIAEALLDQRCLAGLGTVYVAETLFLAGVCPMTPVLDVPDLTKVVRLAYRLITFNKVRDVQVTTGNVRRGQEHYVYLRTGQPCRRCDQPIVTDLVGAPPKERRTYWCPSCQPLG
jgi:endonuclease-8